MANSQHTTTVELETSNNNIAQEINSNSFLFNITFSFINSMSLNCAVELGIADVLQRHSGRPLTLSELATELNIPPQRTPYLARLMRKLEHLGLFTQKPNAEGLTGYTLTPSSLRLSNHFAPFVSLITGPVMFAGWRHLSSWIRGDDNMRSPFHAAHGMGLWEYANSKPEFNELFNKAMTKDADLVVSEVVAKCGPILDGVRSLVDVGGGNGTIGRAIVEAYPHVSCIVFDLPHVVKGLPEMERVKYVGGNMFDSVPSADVVLLKHILHDHNDEDCVKILQQCKKSHSQEGKCGKVIVVDMVLNVIEDQDPKFIENQFFYDLEMMTLLQGKEREEHEFQEIFTQAGFKDYKITSSIVDFLCIIEVFP